MKKFYSLVALLAFLMIGTASAKDGYGFEDLNKKVNVSDVDYVYSLDVYQDGKIAQSLTLAEARNVYGEFSTLLDDAVLYFLNADNNDAFSYITSSSDIVAQVGTPAEGAFIISAVKDDVNYIQLYDTILVAKQVLPTLALDQHQGWQSNTSNVSAEIKNKIGGISNNYPYDQLKYALNEASKTFAAKTYNTATYYFAKQSLNNCIAEYSAMFEALETLRDSIALLRDYYENGTYNVEGTERAVKNFPCNDALLYGPDGTNGVNSQLVSNFRTADNYASIAGAVALCYTTENNLKENCARYDAKTLAYYDKITDPTQYTEATSNNDYPTIPNISYAEYGSFVKIPTLQMVDAATNFGKEVAAWSGSAPFVSYPGIAMATAMFAANMYFAGSLMAEDIKHIITLQEVIDWLNLECQDDYAYAFLTEEVDRSKMNLRSAEKTAIAELQHGILKNALARAQELDALGAAKRDFQEKMYEAQDVYYEMSTKRGNNDTNFQKHQAKENLRKLMSAAEIEKDKQYVLKKKTYDYSENGGEYSLYDFEWYNADGTSFAGGQDETPSQIVRREITKLSNGLSLYQWQYDLENKLDELMAYMDDDKIFASPRETVNQAWLAGEAFNNEVSQNKKLIEDIQDELVALEDALDEAKEHQAKIEEEIAITEDIIEDMVNNGPDDKLQEELEDAIEAFEKTKDWDAVMDVIRELTDQRNWDKDIFDKPDNYLGGTPDGQFEGMIAQAQEWYDENVANMTPMQISAVDNALSIARTALSEWNDKRYNDEPNVADPDNNYDELERDYLLQRMYFAGLALEYVQKMTISEDGVVEPDEAEQQLAEAIVLVALTAAAATNDPDAVAAYAEALMEANDIFRDEDSSDDEMIFKARSLKSMLGTQTTAIAGMKANTELKDGKYIIGSKMVIVKGGKKFNANGVAF